MPIPEKLLSGFKYRIDLLKPGESAILKWPEIAANEEVFIAEDIGECDPEVVLKYLILCYTPDSPVVLQHPNAIGKRKTLALELLDIEPDIDGKYGIYNPMMLVRGDGMRRRLAVYLSLQHSVEWAILSDAQTELESVIESRPSEVIQESIKRRELIENLRITIKNSLDRITEYEDSKALQESILYFTSQRSIKIRPEEVMGRYPSTSPQNAKAAPHQ